MRPVAIADVLPYMFVSEPEPAVPAVGLAPQQHEQHFDDLDEQQDPPRDFNNPPEEEDFGQEVADTMADVTASFETPGMMHICHNAANAVKHSMHHFKATVQSTKVVATLLGTKRRTECWQPVSQQAWDLGSPLTFVASTQRSIGRGGALLRSVLLVCCSWRWASVRAGRW